ncbi:MAG: hypothetical protein WBL63_07005, partial [Candidatus Acidiferrum sp.]
TRDHSESIDSTPSKLNMRVAESVWGRWTFADLVSVNEGKDHKADPAWTQAPSVWKSEIVRVVPWYRLS